MSKMKIVIISISILIIVSIISLFINFSTLEQKHVVNNFMDSILYSQSDNYKNYIITPLSHHTFIDIIKNKLISDYRISRHEKISNKSILFFLMLETESGSIKTSIKVEKLKNNWLVTQLPNVQIFDAVVAVSENERTNSSSKWDIDNKGTIYESLISLDPELIKQGNIYSMILLDNYILKAEPLSSINLNKVLSVNDNSITDISYGKIDTTGLSVYSNDNGIITYRGYNNISPGISNALLYTCNGKGKIFIFQEKSINYENIRVLLMNNEFINTTHKDVTISCDGIFEINSYVESLCYIFNPNDVIRIIPENEGISLYKDSEKLGVSQARWHITPKENHPIKLIDLERNYTQQIGYTPYRGDIEVSFLNNELVVINEVNLEKYLYSVVPSEMPVTFGLEALKVQAIAARSFAIRNINQSNFKTFGAHVVDSTSSQVYNNYPESDIVIRAVTDTKGLVPLYNGSVVDTRFFSTSCGYTANAHEVWSDSEGNFPGDIFPYLSAQPQYDGYVPDLHSEKNFRSFISNRDINGYDQFSPYFRWNFTMSREQLEASINRNIHAIQKSQQDFVLTRNSNGDYIKNAIPENIGTLMNLEIIKRGESGNAMELEITSSSGVYNVLKELNIRRILQPVNYLTDSPIILFCHDGSIRENFNVLPSSFFYIDLVRESNGQIKELVFNGGGYGHGVGMSQYGTYGLTLLGMNYSQIIDHYYPSSTIVNIYEFDILGE